MKNSLTKIMGVVLTLAILAGLLMSVVPVSAAASDEGFGGLPGPLPPPGGTTTYVINNGSIAFFAQAADGLTQFAWDSGNNKLMKSTDGGAKWAPTPAGNTLNGQTVTAMAISNNYANDSTIIAAVGTTIYRSTNGGTTFGTVPGTSGLAGTINSLAYGLDINGADYNMLVGSSSGMWIWSTSDYLVHSQAIATGSVLAVKFSPNYSVDNRVFAVSVNAGTVSIQQADVSTTTTYTPTWSAAATVAAAATAAVIAANTDYDPASNNIFLVGLNPGGLYRIDFTDVAVPTATSKSSSATTSIAINSSGTTYFGLNTGDVKSIADAFSGSTNPTTTSATKKPYPNNLAGANAKVVLNNAGNVVVAESTLNGGIYTSTDAGVTYNGTGLIAYDTTLVYDSFDVIDANIWYLMTVSGAAHYMLMKTTNAGAAWQVIFNYDATTTDVLGIYPSPLYSTDKTLFIALKNRTVWKTVNEGSTFTSATAPGPGGTVTTTAFAAKDGATYYIGYSTNNAVYKSGRSAASAPYAGAGNISSLLVAPNGDIIMGTTDANVYKSVDDGATFAKVVTTPGNIAGTGNVAVTLAPDYVSSNVLYAVSDSIYMLDTAGSKWVNIDTNAATTALPSLGTDASTEVVAASNNAVYYNRINKFGFGRTLSPSVPPGPPTEWGYAVKATSVLSSLNLIGNQLYAVSNGNSLTMFNDLTVAPAASTTPANNAANVPSNNIQFTWTAFAGIPYSIGYDVQVARDAKFVSKIVNETNVAGTLYVYSGNPSQFLPGTAYYYRVRVTPNSSGNAAGTGSPLASAWSPVVTFTVALSADVAPGINAADRLSPANGAVGVSLTPVITWGAVAGATSYNIKIATDPAFTAVVDSKDGLTGTVYTPAAALKAGTNYFWEVQPVNGTVAGAFVVSAFTTTTGAAATVAPPATVTIPPITVPTPIVTVSVPPATVTTMPGGTTGTPAWAWVVIVIGAVLVIAVIVLIVRTRRV